MATPDGHLETPDTDDSPQPHHSRTRWWRYGALAIVLALAGGLGFSEGVVYLRRHQSVEKIKSWSRTLPAKSQIALQNLETQLIGTPQRQAIKYQGTSRIIYTWPGILGQYRLRAQINREGNVIYLDTEHNEEEDFMTPFLVANDDGVRVIRRGDVPLSQIPADGGINLLTASGAAFAAPKSALIPGIVIFPVMDHQDVITSAGPALSMTCQNSLVFTTRKRMALDPRLVRRTLMEAHCWIPGTRLDAGRIDLCLKMIGATSCAVPRIEQRDGQWHVHVEFRDIVDRAPIPLEFQATDLNQVPGVMALGLFAHLGEALSPEERSAVVSPQFQHPAEAEYFSEFKPKDMSSHERAQEFHDRLLVANPLWIAAWDYYRESPSPLRSLDPRMQGPTTIDVRLSASGVSKGTFLAMLKFAPELRGEPYFHQSLVAHARQLQDKILIGQMLTTWKAEDNSYPSRVARAHELIELGQFLQAQDDLEQALVLNFQGWTAHTEMIRVAAGLNQSWEQIHQHFKKAINLDPDNRQAWQYIMFAVWTGDRTRRSENADALFHFANECLDSGLWDQSIPQQVPDLLRAIAYDAKEKKVDFNKFQNPHHWQVMEKFYRLALQAKLSPSSLRHSQACFAHDAAITGHYFEAAPVFDLLDLPYSMPKLPSGSLQTVVDPLVSRFGSLSRYLELRDKVRAAVRSGTTPRD